MRFAFGEAHEQPAERHASGALVTRERNRKFADSPLEGNGFELPVLGFRSSIFYTAPETWSRKGPRSASRVLTTDNGRFTVHRARLAPAMISTPGHRASRWRQRGALSAWRDFLESRLGLPPIKPVYDAAFGGPGAGRLPAPAQSRAANPTGQRGLISLLCQLLRAIARRSRRLACGA